MSSKSTRPFLTGAIARRSFLGAASALAPGLPAWAQRRAGPPPHERGPAVFLDYDQVELDAAYDQAVYAPNEEQISRRWLANSDLARARLGVPRRVKYGPSEIEQLDIYPAKRRKAPIHLFVHGGAWRGGSARASAFPAELFVTAGAHYVVPDFIAVQDAGGNLAAMVTQVRRAIAWVYRNAISFGGDAARIYISAHSSGAHLAAVALTTPGSGEPELPGDVIKGALLVSGMYDLKGPRLSSRGSYVKFDDAIEQALSPQRHLDRLRTPVIVAYAALDTPEFQRQSRDFAAALRLAGKPVALIPGNGYNHFEFIETLANPYGVLGRAALTQMGLQKAKRRRFALPPPDPWPSERVPGRSPALVSPSRTGPLLRNRRTARRHNGRPGE
jgi:arylformamidase